MIINTYSFEQIEKKVLNELKQGQKKALKKAFTELGLNRFLKHQVTGKKLNYNAIIAKLRYRVKKFVNSLPYYQHSLGNKKPKDLITEFVAHELALKRYNKHNRKYHIKLPKKRSYMFKNIFKRFRIRFNMRYFKDLLWLYIAVNKIEHPGWLKITYVKKTLEKYKRNEITAAQALSNLLHFEDFMREIELEEEYGGNTLTLEESFENWGDSHNVQIYGKFESYD